ncbi:hypothetical protein ACFX15_027890 [Malus domestica]
MVHGGMKKVVLGGWRGTLPEYSVQLLGSEITLAHLVFIAEANAVRTALVASMENGFLDVHVESESYRDD